LSSHEAAKKKKCGHGGISQSRQRHGPIKETIIPKRGGKRKKRREERTKAVPQAGNFRKEDFQAIVRWLKKTGLSVRQGKGGKEKPGLASLREQKESYASPGKRVKSDNRQVKDSKNKTARQE